MKKLIYLLTLFPLLINCQQSNSPIDIKWDRDICERCKMVISDQRFATQIHGGPQHQSHLFDDLGCALNWLEKQDWKEEATTRIWVTDYRNGQWLDAHQAHFIMEKMTPMNYGIGATAENMPDSIDFQTAKKHLLLQLHADQH